MRNLYIKSLIVVSIATLWLVVLTPAPVAIAQAGSGSGISAGSQSQSGREAPIGHRQPRADQIPSEKISSNRNDPINKEDAALDRKIKSICRGC